MWQCAQGGEESHRHVQIHKNYFKKRTGNLNTYTKEWIKSATLQHLVYYATCSICTSFSQSWTVPHTSSPHSQLIIYRTTSTQLHYKPMTPLSPPLYNTSSDSSAAWFYSGEAIYTKKVSWYTFWGSLSQKEFQSLFVSQCQEYWWNSSAGCAFSKGWLNCSGIGKPWGSWRGRFYFCLCWKFIFFIAVKNLNQLQFYRKDKLPHPDNLYPSL